MATHSFFIPPRPISRRTMLKASGVALGLPYLDAMGAESERKPPRRMVCVLSDNGFMPEYFNPKTSGFGYEHSDYTRLLDEFRDDFTVFTGVSLPEVHGAHATTASYLSGAPNPGSASFRNSISMDQFCADRIGHETRYSSLPLNVFTPQSISVTQSGVSLPAISDPAEVYRMLFVQGSKEEVAAQANELGQGRSVLDKVLDRSRRFASRLGRDDRDKLDHYMTSVRDAEQKLQQQMSWVHRPKPKVSVKEPQRIEDPTDILTRMRLHYQMSGLALETDSTRLATLFINSGGFGRVFSLEDETITQGWHPLTHGASNPENRRLLKKIEAAHFTALGEFLGQLRDMREGGETVLDRTMVLHGSNLGIAGRHVTNNMPMLLAGGGFKHGQHLAFDQENNYPLSNLYLSMIQRMGLEVDSFSSSSGTMRGLDLV